MRNDAGVAGAGNGAGGVVDFESDDDDLPEIEPADDHLPPITEGPYALQYASAELPNAREIVLAALRHGAPTHPRHDADVAGCLVS